MKAKLLFGAGMAAGYVLGSRSGRAAYDKLKSRAAALWQSKPVQDQMAAAAETVREKAPEVAGQLGEAARRAGTVVTSAVRGDAGAMPAGTAADVDSDPALNDSTGQDWSDEGGATTAGAATNVDPERIA